MRKEKSKAKVNEGPIKGKAKKKEFNVEDLKIGDWVEYKANPQYRMQKGKIRRMDGSTFLIENEHILMDQNNAYSPLLVSSNGKADGPLVPYGGAVDHVAKSLVFGKCEPVR